METHLTLKAYAKINLGLDVTGRRANGYHDVRMVMQTIGLYDSLTYEVIDRDAIELTSNCRALEMDESNIIYKACALMRSEYKIEQGVRVSLDKQIPIAAGMAGGSTDAAATLVAMNRMFDLGLSQDELMGLGVRLGADVPYCVIGGTALAEGIGELLTPLSPMPDCHIVVAKPPVGVSTKEVYQRLDAEESLAHPDIDGIVSALESGSLGGVSDRLSNVLEAVTITLHPEIEDIKHAMIEGGAMGALMSGSGPTVFGIYREQETAAQAAESLEHSGMVECAYAVRPVSRENL